MLEKSRRENKLLQCKKHENALGFMQYFPEKNTDKSSACEIVKKPIECLEYVLIHELVHLLEKNHTNRFKTLVEKYYPAWREAKQILADMPLDYWENNSNDMPENISAGKTAASSLVSAFFARL